MSNPARPVTTQLIQTSWGLDVSDTVVRRYPTVAARDADLTGFTPAALTGQVVYCDDIASLLVYANARLGWRRPWADPFGAATVGLGSPSGAIGGAALVAVTGVAFTPLGGRIYSVTSHVDLLSFGGGTIVGRLTYNGAIAHEWSPVTLAPGSRLPVGLTTFDTSPAWSGGAKNGVYGLSVYCTAGDASFGGGEAMILVTDVGPWPSSSAPAP